MWCGLLRPAEIALGAMAAGQPLKPLPKFHRSKMSPQSVLKCLPIGDEVVEVQRLVRWSWSLRQYANQRTRAVHHEHAAIIIVPLLGHAG